MSKYTPEELKAMAQRVMRAKEKSDDRFIELGLTVAAVTALSPEDVFGRIRKLAED